MAEYRVKVSIRNNLLLSAIEAAGFPTQAAFARAIGLRAMAIHELVCMKIPPIGNSGEFTPAAKAVMEALGAAPCELWTDQQLCMRLRRNSSEIELDGPRLAAIMDHELRAQRQITMGAPGPADGVERGELQRAVGGILSDLSPREAEVIRLRFGFPDGEDLTVDEVAERLELSPGRIRQLESAALRKMRHPSRLVEIEDFLPETSARWACEFERRAREAESALEEVGDG